MCNLSGNWDTREGAPAGVIEQQEGSPYFILIGAGNGVKAPGRFLSDNEIEASFPDGMLLGQVDDSCNQIVWNNEQVYVRMGV